MPTWEPIEAYKGEPFPRGTLFKFRAKYPFEEFVVMMLCEADGALGLIAITGYKAGIRPTTVLPGEAFANGPGGGVDPRWLVENWTAHIWADVNLDEVLVREALTVADL